MPALFDEDVEDWQSYPGGLSVSEDDKQVFVTAALPGVEEKDIDITYDKGVLWIKGASQEETSAPKRTYYRKSTANFSYSVTVPGDIDTTSEPQATYKNGVMTVVFAKHPQSQPKKIKVQGHTK
jgi:HSP20 family protein